MADNNSIAFDTWLLQSVLLANVEGRGTPEKILAAADLLSKTPMLESELHSGLARLIQKGLVRDNQWYYSTTDSVPSDLKWSEREKIRELLSIQIPEEQNETPVKTGDYVKKFQGFMSKLINPER
ncbi:MAG: hypothetical protein TUN42_08880 [Dehalogenimonas sp.]